jgi:hypothetical protein
LHSSGGEEIFGGPESHHFETVGPEQSPQGLSDRFVIVHNEYSVGFFWQSTVSLPRESVASRSSSLFLPGTRMSEQGVILKKPLLDTKTAWHSLNKKDIGP